MQMSVFRLSWVAFSVSATLRLAPIHLCKDERIHWNTDSAFDAFYGYVFLNANGYSDMGSLLYLVNAEHHS